MKRGAAKKVQSIKTIELARWVFTITLLFLAITKMRIIFLYGLEPYTTLPKLFQLPEWLKYYGVFAVIIEVSCAIFIWYEQLFFAGIIPFLTLSIAGVLLSIISITRSLQIDCGCGFFGDDELTFLIQKILVLGCALILFRNKKRLFGQHQVFPA